MTTNGTFTFFPAPVRNAGTYGSSNPRSITIGPDGALWFGNSNSLCRITTAGTITQYLTTSDVYAITIGPDGALWFTENSPNPIIGRMTTKGVLTEYPMPNPRSQPTLITTGPDGALWWIDDSDQVYGDGGDADVGLGRITTSGSFSESALPVTFYNFGGPFISAPDGGLWLPEGIANGNDSSISLDRFTTNLQLSQYSVETDGDELVDGGAINTITVGPDGALWFMLLVDCYNNCGSTVIGRITTGLTPNIGKRFPSLRLPSTSRQTPRPTTTAL
jgi:virginiamycin B lyase